VIDENLISFKELQTKYQLLLVENRLLKEEINAFKADRSSSGNGGHAWFFFGAPISATLARKFGTSLLTHATNERHEITFKSYDRFFPNQDTMPRGGLGNLIALPLQKEARLMVP